VRTPKDIKKYLDQYVIGQEQAKKALAVAAYNHYKRITLGGKLKKSNVLIIGPTGSGKTYMVSLLAEVLRVKFVSVDATQFTASGYVGRDVEEIVVELYKTCNRDEHIAAQSIVYIDEIDKIKRKTSSDGSADVNGSEVQQALLKLLEGTEVSFSSSGSKIDPHDMKISTKNIMFICSGAFVGLESPTTAALTKFGMIPEFLGRFPVVTSLNALTPSDMKKILLDSKGSILESFREWFTSEGITLQIEESGISAIVDKAVSKNVGARGLHNVIDEAVLNAQFEVPSFPKKPKAFVLDADVVNTGIPKWVW
jgi:ATP-dependent Clp protease ATP-binding subunit ClpX